MAVVLYKCDTCKREIEIPQNKTGLEVMSHCVITSGCKGKLIQTAVKSSYVRGKLPDPDPTGLKDWLPRRVFFKTFQDVAIKKWKVEHNLGTNPSLQVHINLVDGTLVETTDYEFKYINPFEVEITFSEPRSGIAQCFARSSVTDEQREVILTQTDEEVPLLNITGGGVLTLAIPPSSSPANLKIGFISSVTNEIVYYELIEFTTNTSPLSPWWKPLTVGTTNVKVFFSGKLWELFTTRLDDDIIANDEITNGSTFFITDKKSFEIVSVNETNKTVTVKGIFDPSLLPFKKLEITGPSFVGGNPYSIVSALNNTDGTTTIQLSTTFTNTVPYGNVLVDYPVGISKMYVMLSTYPHSTHDKNTSSVLDVNKLSLANSHATSQIGGVLYVKEDQTRPVFPLISN